MGNKYSDKKITSIALGIVLIFVFGFSFGRYMFESKHENFKVNSQLFASQNVAKPELIMNNDQPETLQREFRNINNHSDESSGSGNLNPSQTTSKAEGEKPELPAETQNAYLNSKNMDVSGGCGTISYKGDQEAPVWIVEFAEYQNQDCAKFFKEIFPALENKFINKGRVKYFFRDCFDESNETSLLAAIAARCANAQGKYWNYHDILLNNYNSINSDKLKVWAQDLGLDQAIFNDCFETKRSFVIDIKNDIVDAEKSGVKRVPSFFINGKFFRDEVTLENLEKIIDQEYKSIGSL